MQLPTDTTLKAVAVALGIVVVFSLLGLVAAAETVDEGEVAVLKDQGAVTGDTYEPGWHLKTPIVESTETISTRPQTYTMSGDPWEGDQDEVDSIEFMSADQQQVNADVTVRYRVPETQAPSFHTEWNTLSQAESRLIRPVTEGVVQQRGSSMDATEANSEVGRSDLSESIRTELESETGQEIVVEDVQVRDIHLDPSFAGELEEIEVEEARAEQRIIEAESQAEADAIRDEELTEEVLMELYIEQIDESDTVILATGEDGTPVILDAESEAEPVPGGD